MFPNRVLNIIRRFKRPPVLATDARLMLQLLVSAMYADKHVRIECIEEVLTWVHANTAINVTTPIPAGSILLFAQMNTDQAFTFDTAVKIGLGTAADPDLFALSAGTVINKNDKTYTLGVAAAYLLAAQTTVQIQCVDVAGAAAGHLETVGKIRVQLVYLVADVIQNAP